MGDAVCQLKDVLGVIGQLYGDDARTNPNNVTVVYVRNGMVYGLVNRGHQENIGWGYIQQDYSIKIESNFFSLYDWDIDQLLVYSLSYQLKFSKMLKSFAIKKMASLCLSEGYVWM